MPPFVGLMGGMGRCNLLLRWLPSSVWLGAVAACAAVTSQPLAAQQSPQLVQNTGDGTPEIGNEPQDDAPPAVQGIEPEPPASDNERSTEPFEAGYASWYGARFHKRRTASGELFNMNAYTAAHPSLPFGTLVCVHSPQTGKTVQVRINDRGPHTRNRIMDMSRAAAKAMGIAGHGVKHVELTHPLPGTDFCPER